MKCGIKPIGLKCEYLVNPIGIDVLKPRLTWALQSEFRGQVQNAYQILVASSIDKLDSDDGDLWDSGKVLSDRMTHIVYNGRPMASRMCCFWKVRVWDGGGNVSEYSETARWEMGLINHRDWKAKWIGSGVKVIREYNGLTFKEYGNWRGKWVVENNEKAENDEKAEKDDTKAAPLFRKEIIVRKNIKKAVAYICGLGCHEFYLNGEKIGDHVIDPAFTRYDKRVLTVTHDVTDYLKNGANVIGILLGNGWYNLHTRSTWLFDSAPWRSAPKMLFQMQIHYEDGTEDIVISDDSWKMTKSPLTYNDVFGGETYDARLEKTGWHLPGYDDSGWERAAKVRGPYGRIFAQMAQPIKITKTIKPFSISEPKPGVYVFDLAQIFSGWARLKVQGAAGTEVRMTFSQNLLEDGTVNEWPNRACLVQIDPSHRSHLDIYILKGDGVEVWEPRFCYHGFRYVQVEGYPGKPDLDSILGCVVHTAVEEVSSFDCSNQLINKIWNNTKWSHVSNLHGYPTDCPHREKNGWSGDAHLAAEQGIFNFNMAPVYTKWLNDFSDEQKVNGDLPAIIPTSNDWGYDLGIAWDSAYFLIPWYMYLYCGDVRILETHYEGMKKYLDCITFKADGYIVPFGFDDWVCPGERTPSELISTSYFYTDAIVVSKIAALLNREDDEKYYKELADKIKKAFNDKLYNKETGIYANGTQTAQCCPLYQGLVDEEEKSKVLDRLVEKVEEHDWHLNTGILGTKYLPHVLTEYGRTDVAYRIATQTTYPSWGYWVSLGATALYETWDPCASDNGTSWIHIMFGDISAWFYKGLAGINVDEKNPGFKNIIVRPHPVADLTNAKVDYMSICGRIMVEWELKDGQLILELDIPANTSATVYIPAAGPDVVFEGGNPASQSECVKYMYMKDGFVVYSVGSGRYSFTSVLRDE